MYKSAFAFLLGAGMILGLSLVTQKPPASAEPDKKNHRIVFHLSTPDTAAYRALTKQLTNIREHWPDAEIEVVAHNKGVAMLQSNKTNVANEVQAAMNNRVRFVVCEQTLKNMNIPRESIVPNAGFVERGLVEIVEKQEAGWSYIKAGF
ncbi:MAG: DsrE family protein [Saprospiraceae bacterium]|nr:DsrE family protein [Saprospiraceae bacterium]